MRAASGAKRRVSSENVRRKAAKICASGAAYRAALRCAYHHRRLHAAAAPPPTTPKKCTTRRRIHHRQLSRQNYHAPLFHTRTCMAKRMTTRQSHETRHGRTDDLAATRLQKEGRHFAALMAVPVLALQNTAPAARRSGINGTVADRRHRLSNSNALQAKPACSTFRANNLTFKQKKTYHVSCMQHTSLHTGATLRLN